MSNISGHLTANLAIKQGLVVRMQSLEEPLLTCIPTLRGSTVNLCAMNFKKASNIQSIVTVRLLNNGQAYSEKNFDKF